VLIPCPCHPEPTDGHIYKKANEEMAGGSSLRRPDPARLVETGFRVTTQRKVLHRIRHVTIKFVVHRSDASIGKRTFQLLLITCATRRREKVSRFHVVDWQRAVQVGSLSSATVNLR